MPRWWRDGTRWLDALPELVERQIGVWNLSIDGDPMHGSNALVVPVRQGRQPLVLRMTPPDAAVATEVRALRFWDGRGTVRLFDADIDAGATLLERVDGSVSTGTLPLDRAIPILARLLRRLAIPAPPDVRATGEIAQERIDNFERSWQRLGRPFRRRILDAALRLAEQLTTTTSSAAVNGDLHFEQVLAAEREPWLCVDPVLLRGDIEYDLARVLWSRLDEMTDDREVRRHFDAMVSEAGLDPERAQRWLVFRTVDYWIWGLEHELTEDPRRCAALIDVFLPPNGGD